MNDKQSTSNSTKVLLQFQSGQILRLLPHPGTGLIICKAHHAELAGWGAAVGGIFDLDVRQVLPIGEFSLGYPESHKERKNAFNMRKKWFDVLLKVTSIQSPLQRALGLLQLLEKYFGLAKTIELPDEILAQLIGVLPKTVAIARSSDHRFRWSEKGEKVEAKRLYRVKS